MDARRTAQELGLSDDDFAAICEGLGRTPNLAELGMFAAMWSEHCAYRSSKALLRRLPSQGARVVEGPGENAGAVDIGGGLSVVFKMESHNHPSFIEPYQGAATGVGGIMRDIFTMGARPVAFLNALRFGAPDHPKTRHLLTGVVAGIGGYGNCVGVPTVGGELDFDPSYNGNILVNAMCAGIVRTDRIFRARLERGHRVMYIGARTGRDGIQGAVMASANFGGGPALRSAVQIGDPFMQKLLLEACLELMEADLIASVQDMGAAGLTSSAVEMAARGGAGVRLDLDAVPTREPDMSAYEIMLSESQERMLLGVSPGREDAVRAVCAKWGLASAMIGEATGEGRIVLTRDGREAADLPLSLLADGAPPAPRPTRRRRAAAREAEGPCDAAPLDEALLRLLSGPDACSRRWVWEQYDHDVMADTLQRPGGDAAVVRVHGTRKALALTTEVTPRYCVADARGGARQAVAEAFRNLTATGAVPLALTDCLNFGSPEDPEVMGDFAAAIDGLAGAARALDMPVVSGNVSFYNQTGEAAIAPTPALGAVGLIEDYAHMARPGFEAGAALIVIGETGGHMSRSLFAQRICGRGGGLPPPVDLEAEARNGDFVRAQIASGHLKSVHDVSGGGLLVAIAEMALMSGIGAVIGDAPAGMAPHVFFFAEDQGRYVVACPEEEASGFLARAAEAKIPARRAGRAGGDNLTLPGCAPISLGSLARAHESWLPAYAAGEDPMPPARPCR